ncbi:MAG: hypothetical protein M0R75_15900 [Dehalococcoidia bacterium]|nr:hypothetical protein [Dehalococcoidia bacterium]
MTIKHRPPTVPKGLAAKGAGRKIWREITSRYRLRADELRILEDACREADLVDRLETALADAPLTVNGSMGQPVANPLVQEVRQHRNTLKSLLSSLKLPDDDATAAPNAGEVLSTGARAAAAARWGRRGA